MSVHRAAPVTEEPEVTLDPWTIFELPNGDRHFAGYNVGLQEGRISTKIVSFNPKLMRGVTKSGRIYQLRGLPYLHGDADYLMRMHVAANWKDLIKIYDELPEDWKNEGSGDHSGPAEAQPN